MQGQRQGFLLTHLSNHGSGGPFLRLKSFSVIVALTLKFGLTVFYCNSVMFLIKTITIKTLNNKVRADISTSSEADGCMCLRISFKA